MPADFHALRDAKGKHYRYIINTGNVPSALYHDRSWYVHQSLDLKSMQKASRMLVGKHDFSAFKASGSNVKDAVRTIHAIQVKRMRKAMIGIPCPVKGFSIDVLGDGFVRHMVRNIVGWLVETGRGRISLDEARRIFKGKKRTEAGVCAPASGLYVMEVFY
jgi:tRNA pseudouridine38-40 synthase